MNGSTTHNKFIFSKEIDSSYLFELYEDDYSSINQIFLDAVEELENEMMTFAMAFNAGDVHSLRQVAHKIKPLFGFTGLLSVQDAVNNFEDHCSEVKQVGILSREYELLLEEINNSKQVLTLEQTRLEEFIANAS